MIETIIISNLISLVIGVLIGEPLKNLINGNIHKNIKVKKEINTKDKILKYFKANHKTIDVNKLKSELFKDEKISTDEIYNYLKVLEQEGFVHNIIFDGQTRETSLWRFIA